MLLKTTIFCPLKAAEYPYVYNMNAANLSVKYGAVHVQFLKGA